MSDNLGNSNVIVRNINSRIESIVLVLIAVLLALILFVLAPDFVFGLLRIIAVGLLGLYVIVEIGWDGVLFLGVLVAIGYWLLHIYPLKRNEEIQSQHVSESSAGELPERRRPSSTFVFLTLILCFAVAYAVEWKTLYTLLGICIVYISTIWATSETPVSQKE